MATLADRIGFARRKPTSASLNLAYRPARPCTAPCCTLSGVQSGRGYPRPARPRAASPGGIGGAASDRDSAGGSRDYAILLVLARLALRGGRSPGSSTRMTSSRAIASCEACSSVWPGPRPVPPSGCAAAPPRPGQPPPAAWVPRSASPSTASLPLHTTVEDVSPISWSSRKLLTGSPFRRAARNTYYVRRIMCRQGSLLPCICGEPPDTCRRRRFRSAPRGRLGRAGWVWGWWPTLSIR